MTFNKVVLPEPLGPISPRTSPPPSAALTPRTAAMPPKDFPTSWSVSSGSGTPVSSPGFLPLPIPPSPGGRTRAVAPQEDVEQDQGRDRVHHLTHHPHQGSAQVQVFERGEPPQPDDPGVVAVQ